MSAVISSLRIVNVTAFIDWNSQLLLTKRSPTSAPEDMADTALRMTTRRIARCLDDLDSSKRYRVMMRLYHGWHQGYEPTPNRRAAQIVIGKADYPTLSQRSNVIFLPNVEFGDRLSNALDRRLHKRLGIHLPNTLRKRSDNEFEEKMVDTALTADVLTTAHRDTSDWILVVTEDDDLIPAVFAAEAALTGTGAKVLLLRSRSQQGMIPLDDILRNG